MTMWAEQHFPAIGNLDIQDSSTTLTDGKVEETSLFETSVSLAARPVESSFFAGWQRTFHVHGFYPPAWTLIQGAIFLSLATVVLLISSCFWSMKLSAAKLSAGRLRLLAAKDFTSCSPSDEHGAPLDPRQLQPDSSAQLQLEALQLPDTEVGVLTQEDEESIATARTTLSKLMHVVSLLQRVISKLEESYKQEQAALNRAVALGDHKQRQSSQENMKEKMESLLEKKDDLKAKQERLSALGWRSSQEERVLLLQARAACAGRRISPRVARALAARDVVLAEGQVVRERPTITEVSVAKSLVQRTLDEAENITVRISARGPQLEGLEGQWKLCLEEVISFKAGAQAMGLSDHVLQLEEAQRKLQAALGTGSAQHPAEPERRPGRPLRRHATIPPSFGTQRPYPPKQSPVSAPSERLSPELKFSQSRADDGMSHSPSHSLQSLGSSGLPSKAAPSLPVGQPVHPPSRLPDVPQKPLTSTPVKGLPSTQSLDTPNVTSHDVPNSYAARQQRLSACSDIHPAPEPTPYPGLHRPQRLGRTASLPCDRTVRSQTASPVPAALPPRNARGLQRPKFPPPEPPTKPQSDATRASQESQAAGSGDPQHTSQPHISPQKPVLGFMSSDSLHQPSSGIVGTIQRAPRQSSLPLSRHESFTRPSQEARPGVHLQTGGQEPTVSPSEKHSRHASLQRRSSAPPVPSRRPSKQSSPSSLAQPSPGVSLSPLKSLSEMVARSKRSPTLEAPQDGGSKGFSSLLGRLSSVSKLFSPGNAHPRSGPAANSPNETRGAAAKPLTAGSRATASSSDQEFEASSISESPSTPSSGFPPIKRQYTFGPGTSPRTPTDASRPSDGNERSPEDPLPLRIPLPGLQKEHKASSGFPFVERQYETSPRTPTDASRPSDGNERSPEDPLPLRIPLPGLQKEHKASSGFPSAERQYETSPRTPTDASRPSDGNERTRADTLPLRIRLPKLRKERKASSSALRLTPSSDQSSSLEGDSTTSPPDTPLTEPATPGPDVRDSQPLPSSDSSLVEQDALSLSDNLHSPTLALYEILGTVHSETAGYEVPEAGLVDTFEAASAAGLSLLEYAKELRGGSHPPKQGIPSSTSPESYQHSSQIQTPSPSAILGLSDQSAPPGEDPPPLHGPLPQSKGQPGKLTSDEESFLLLDELWKFTTAAGDVAYRAQTSHVVSEAQDSLKKGLELIERSKRVVSLPLKDPKILRDVLKKLEECKCVCSTLYEVLSEGWQSELASVNQALTGAIESAKMQRSGRQPELPRAKYISVLEKLQENAKKSRGLHAEISPFDVPSMSSNMLSTSLVNVRDATIAAEEELKEGAAFCATLWKKELQKQADIARGVSISSDQEPANSDDALLGLTGQSEEPPLKRVLEEATFIAGRLMAVVGHTPEVRDLIQATQQIHDASEAN
ncbi:hypothetical protein, conserved [Eimeria necatrix]|uniref:Uncharacterized protein n=1 Tax=Eimeria necatrix TaxID=51315 RepID=U6N5C3_9EIME|nr:hypothetical protein, conserved [Eimeria necatrix]CDJ70494.1 hypothetical protein, conserved [Eimeria necatrix]